MQTRGQQITEDDIEAVLGRFQAWTGSRDTNAAKDGVREISYEEALGASRYPRRKAAEKPVAEPVSGTPGPDPAVVSTAARMPVKAAKACEPETNKPAAAARKKAEQAFRAALAQSIVAAASKPGRTNGREDRQVVMSVRVAASEHALIKLRAARAGVSISAYLRQCALDVEILRGQVQQLMTASALSRMAELANPVASSPAPVAMRHGGWLGRLRRRIWGGSETQLSLKA